MNIVFNNFLNFCERYQYRFIFAIVALSFLASISHSLYFKISPAVDADFYDEMGWELARGLPYSQGAINRPGPGYEYFLGLVYYLFGYHHLAAWIVQAFLLAVAAFLVFLTTKLIFKEFWHPLMGIVATALVGFSPDLIVMSSMIMTEIFLVFLVVAAIFFFFKYFDSNKFYFLFLTALFLALAVLTKGSALLLLLPMIFYFIFKKDWRSGLLFVLIFILFMTPWTIRNYKIYGQIKPFNSSTGLLYVGNHPGATGELEPNYPMPEGVDHETMPQLEFDDALGRAGVKYIKENPLDFIKLTLWRTSIFFSVSRPTGFWPYLQQRPVARFITLAVSAVYALVVFLFGITGAALSIKKKESDNWRAKYLLVFLLMVPLSVIALVVETRYRFPVYSFFAIFAGYSIYRLIINFKRDYKFLVYSAVLLLGNTLFDVLRNFGRILERIDGFFK